MNQWTSKWTWIKGHAPWVAETIDYRSLAMVREDFNDQDQLGRWRSWGFSPRTGAMFDMRNENQPPMTQKLIDYVTAQGFSNIGVSYYRMDPGDNLPYHSDTYTRYIELHNLEDKKQNIVRFIFFPENRFAGHIFEVAGKLFDWRAGDWIAWKYDTPHMAANLGNAPRYTIQVTGVLNEDIKQ